jgi:flagellar biosynthesis protein FlhG
MLRIFPVGGGKGGTGKSFVSANLAASIARQGKKVVLVDLDLGASNLHLFLGVRNPKTGLHEFMSGRYKKLEQAALLTHIPNLFLIGSNNCSLEIANLFYAQKLKLIRSVKELPFDYAILDLGAGSNFNTLDFFLASNEGVLIFTPEPTSIENAARFIKAVYFRKVKHILKQPAFRAILRAVAETCQGKAIESFRILEFIMVTEPEQGRLLEEKLNEFRFKLILNLFNKNTDPDLGRKIQRVCNRHFHSRFEFMGNIAYDDRVIDSILSSRTYIHKYPYTSTAMDLQGITKKMLGNGLATPMSPRQRHEEF